ncbi:class I SAM-dependent methyltransferase [Sediminibacillus massiliensis]|uniref:class I SAM-dependent methyltransferase n=1 Tax=Sediminibacillus massiliensis TaxID=1926277 RepID=UPI0009887AFF|nr:class I SAM-dependent methyltransferase [Sediminibacillus massiliensis]
MNHDSNDKKHLAKVVEYLDNPEKRGGLPPEQLLDMVPINKKDTILDLGAGTGYMTIPAAKLVDGLVYALDKEPEMLQIIASKARQEGMENIKTMEGDMEEIPLSDNTIDVVIASLVLHEAKDVSQVLQQTKRVLKSDGKFICIELEKETDASNKHPRIHSSFMEKEMNAAGFKIMEKHPASDGIYILLAEK